MNKNQNGFSVIEGLLILVTVGLIGFVGWYVYRTRSTADNKYSASRKLSSSPIASDPYAGWKIYCDNDSEACFKYPADWKVNKDTSEIINPQNTVRIHHNGNYITVESGKRRGYRRLESLTHLTGKNSNFVVLGGYNDPNPIYYPSYDLVNASLVESKNVSIGQQLRLEEELLYTNKNNTRGDLQIIGEAQTEAQAKDWFSSVDGKTSLLIMKSFYFTH